MKTTHTQLCCADRYRFDAMYTRADGWMQFDTSNDASYFGNWINPSQLKAASFCEGDYYEYEMRDMDDFVREIKRWIEYYGVEFKGIDCVFSEALKATLPTQLEEHAH